MISSLLPLTRQRLKARLGQYPVIVRETGLTYSWLQKFANGRINNPTINSLDRLIQYLDETESSSEDNHQPRPQTEHREVAA